MALAKTRITAQGQTSVPAEVRRKLGIGPGSILEWDEHGETVTIRRAGSYTSEDIHRAVFKRSPKRHTTEELKEGIRAHMKRRYARD